MGALQSYLNDTTNPLDLIERLAERRDWSVDRTNDCEVTMVMGGGWSDLYVSLNWRDDLESLLVACTYDMKVPPARKDEVGRLLALINGQLFHGHFDMWQADGSIVFRNNLVLSGGAVANDAQCETLIRLGIESCERYYPAVQYVCWAGQTANAALESSLLETMGEARALRSREPWFSWVPARWAAQCLRAGSNPAPIQKKLRSLIHLRQLT